MLMPGALTLGKRRELDVGYVSVSSLRARCSVECGVLSFSCVTDTVRKSVKATGPLQHKPFTVCTRAGGCPGLAGTLGPQSTLQASPHGGEDHRTLTSGNGRFNTVARRSSVLLTQGGQRIPESEQIWRRALARGVDFDPRKEQIGEEMKVV